MRKQHVVQTKQPQKHSITSTRRPPIQSNRRTHHDNHRSTGHTPLHPNKNCNGLQLLYIINGLTKHLPTWENLGWIDIKNAPFFKRAAYLLKQCTTTTHFKWIKGHNGNRGNKGSDTLAKEGVQKAQPDNLNLTILKEFDIQGARLSAITQTTTYKEILASKPYKEQEAATRNL